MTWARLNGTRIEFLCPDQDFVNGANALILVMSVVYCHIPQKETLVEKTEDEINMVWCSIRRCPG